VNIKIILVIFIVALGIFLIFSVNNIFDFENEKNRPNIVVIMTDDLDVNTLDEMLERNWMPNLQNSIIEKGTEFTNSFVTNSLCCPSRSTFLTGQYSHNHGVTKNPQIQNLNDNHTLATWLQNAGYQTAHVGKYLNGYGTLISDDYIPPGWDNWNALIDPFTYRVYDYKISNNGPLVLYGNSSSDYQTDVLARLSSDFIHETNVRDSNDPFFLVINPLAPHGEVGTINCSIQDIPVGIIRGPPRYDGTSFDLILPKYHSFNETDVSDKPKWIQDFPSINEEDQSCIEMIYQNRIESLRAVDDLIGTVNNALIDKGVLEKTVIIFTSDNGFLLGEHRVWSKNLVYEESIRVPLYITAPGFDTSQSTSRLVTNNDLAPTILEFAGVDADISMDGRSLIPLLLDPNEEDWRNNFLIEHWKHGPEFLQFLPSYQAIRTSSYLYVEYENATGEFYNIKLDPFQMNNLYDCNSSECFEQISALKDGLSDLKYCKDGQCQRVENNQYLEPSN